MKYELKSVKVFRKRLKKLPENRIYISAGSGYGPQTLKPVEALRLAKALVRMATK